MILAGDIGGTKTNLAIFDVKDSKLVLKEEKKYPGSDYESLDKIVNLFLSEHPTKILSASFGIAGPVKEGKAKTTNLPWVIDAKTLANEIKCEHVSLLNDLEANAYGIAVLETKDFFNLNKGDTSIKGNAALISAGTGLGEAGLYWDGKNHLPFACEGGHVDFAARNELEMRLFQFLNKEEEHVSYEKVLSGIGIHNIYRFLLHDHQSRPGNQLQKDLKEKDPAYVISEYALNNKDLICVEALELFMMLYGSEAGNVALKFLAVGGLYIGGGIAPKILEKLKTSQFMTCFCKKGRMDTLLKPIPVNVILNDNAALLGAARFAALQVDLI